MDTGSPLFLPQLPPDGVLIPSDQFNQAMLTLNGSVHVDERLSSEVSIAAAVTLHPTAPPAYGKMHVITGTSADYTITLFTPAMADLGKIIGFRVSNAATKVFTIDAAGSETIDGALTLLLGRNDVVYLKAVATTGNTWQAVIKKKATTAARVFNSANISVANITVQVLTFNSERRDDGAIHDTGSNTDRLTAPVSGWYYIFGNVVFAANATGFRAISVRFGATPDVIAALSCPAISGGDTTNLNISCLYYLAAGEYVKLFAYQNSGAALNAMATAQYGLEFGMIRVDF